MLITDDTIIRRYIPNSLATVKGESTLYEKLYNYIVESEHWIISTFLGEEIYEKFCSEDDKTDKFAFKVANTCRSIIAYDSFLRAVPSLDLILTPNGFGIVNNSNIVPASKERVERLQVYLEKSRDLSIDNLLRFLPKIETWLTTEQCEFFRSTLFPTLYFTKSLGYSDKLWNHYQERREEIMIIEQMLEKSHFSHEQMEVFRMECMAESFASPLHKQVVNGIKNHILAMLKQKPAHPQHLFDILDIIRDNPEDFAEWHSSQLPELYDAPVFKNRKESSAYFF